MTQPSALTTQITERARQRLEGEPVQAKLLSTLRLLAKWRVTLLTNTLLARSGPVVQTGPFKGMAFDLKGAEGGLLTKLIGCYEGELHGVIETVIATAYPQVIDVGSAQGYYAVGLATRMPDTTVLAFDVDDDARKDCASVAEANGVADRIALHGLADHRTFDICADARTFVLCDIEGGEGALLDPDAAPGLRQADILVECHDTRRNLLSRILQDRFAPTHDIGLIRRDSAPVDLPDWADGLSDLDWLFLQWEWRTIPTPWLWMKAKARA